MSHRVSRWMVVMAVAWASVAQAGGDERPRTIAPPKRIPDVLSDAVQPAGEPVASANVPAVVRRAVVADAARRFQVAESAVVLVRAERVTWSDGSLGCPQPGMSYTQLQVPGYRISAKTAAGEMRYHTDERGQVVTCGFPARRSRALVPAG